MDRLKREKHYFILRKLHSDWKSLGNETETEKPMKVTHTIISNTDNSVFVPFRSGKALVCLMTVGMNSLCTPNLSPHFIPILFTGYSLSVSFTKSLNNACMMTISNFSPQISPYYLHSI